MSKNTHVLKSLNRYRYCRTKKTILFSKHLNSIYDTSYYFYISCKILNNIKL